MSKKSYLADQILLMTLKTFDFFTDEEVAIYSQIIERINEYDRLIQDEAPKQELDRVKSEEKILKSLLSEMIAKHTGTPRTVNLKSIIDTRTLPAPEEFPKAIRWKNLKISRRIAEFCSEESRALGLQPNDITFDKVIVKWNSEEILQQIVEDGFYLPIFVGDEVVIQLMRVMTASAGQLRTDKLQFIACDAWDRIAARLQCGLTWDVINEKGGININKYLAYMALPCSATEVWDIDIDRFIVIDDFETMVHGLVDYITKDYEIIRKEMNVPIPHTDGAGMMLPSAAGVWNEELGRWDFPYGANFMLRAPYIKGLVSTFDFIRFCREHNVPAVINDIYHVKHDLIAENIQVILTKSQFKLWKYYEDWEDYKRHFKECGCNICRTNYEEDEIDNTTICYQMMQTLTDFPDECIDRFIANHKAKITNISTDKNSMLRTLHANPHSINPYHRCLAMYPSLLRDGYAKETIKAIKKKWLFDGKSAAIKCKNKRLFVIPDLYAACEYWFLGIENPEGLLKGDEVASIMFMDEDEVAPLRSPHLYMEWMICPVAKDPEIYSWFFTNGIYTSTHSLISRVDQFK